MNHTSPKLRITGKFLLTVLTVSMLVSSVVYAQTVQEWDKQVFAKLNDEDQKTAALVLRGVNDAFAMFEQSVDKGGEQFLGAFNNLTTLYMQLTQFVAPRLDVYKKKLALIEAVSVVPDIEDISQIVQKIIPENPKNERELKRSINKGLRNKKTKQKLKKLIANKHNDFEKYVDYLKKNYADITKSFERTEALLQKIQEGSDKGQDLEQILNNMSPEEQQEVLQLIAA